MLNRKRSELVSNNFCKHFSSRTSTETENRSPISAAFFNNKLKLYALDFNKKKLKNKIKFTIEAEENHNTWKALYDKFLLFNDQKWIYNDVML